MGQKVHPKGLRVGIIRGWESNWYADKNYLEFLHEDLKIREFIKNKFYHAGIAGIQIERAANRVKISIQTAKPGIVIGRGGAEVEDLRKELEQMTKKRINVNIVEVKKPELNALLVAEGIALQLERRISFEEQ